MTSKNERELSFEQATTHNVLVSVDGEGELDVDRLVAVADWSRDAVVLLQQSIVQSTLSVRRGGTYIYKVDKKN